MSAWREPVCDIARSAVILHIEDNAADSELLRDSLSEFPDLNVFSLADGAEALRYLQQCTLAVDASLPDLILLDLNLPGLDGRRILMELRKDPLLRLIPVVVLSGSAREEDMALAYGLGANAYVVKPNELKRFRAVMRAICDFWCGAAAVPGRAARY